MLVALGRVSGPHGVRGWVRVRCLGDGPENLLRQDTVWIGESEDGLGAQPYSVLEAGNARPGELRLRLEGVSSYEQASALRGRWLAGDQAKLLDLAEGEFYWRELIGCQVESTAGEVIGRLVSLMETGAHDVLVVEGADGRRQLLPAAEEFLHEIDVEARRIVVRLIPGLID